MEVQLEHPAEEIRRLRRCINDLVSVIALPAMWSGSERSQIVRTLLDVLLEMLQLDLVYVRLEIQPARRPWRWPGSRNREGCRPGRKRLESCSTGVWERTHRTGRRRCGTALEKKIFRSYPCDWGCR